MKKDQQETMGANERSGHDGATTQGPAIFWPHHRVVRLRAMASDEGLPTDRFERQRQAAWMREFCHEAPSWLEAQVAKQGLQERLRQVQVEVQTAMGHLSDLAQDLDGLCGPRGNLQTDAHWEGQAGNDAAAGEEPQAPSGDLWATEEFKEPKPLPKCALSPTEAHWAQVHGDDATALDASFVRRRVADMEPAAAQRFVIETFAAEREKRQPGRPKKADRQAPKTAAERREASNARAIKRQRTTAKNLLGALTSGHGETVVDYLVHHILHDRVTVSNARAAMGLYQGKSPSRVEANRAAAAVYHAEKAFAAGEDILVAKNLHHVEHADGGCSWWQLKKEQVAQTGAA